ncbi:ribosomal protein L1 [Mytilinidion resinicola]|uniref:Ribosomal protein L1 n=1 Tax=Mytilinidion resinicola TaxID=574789 RepID=A0A6A6Y291_9PEZI|nr:ribosomal protein L1 [Mytilinidion resinicola]KAF2802936.1 ribosomal protein L1 [Mytilinidion resinicola]
MTKEIALTTKVQQGTPYQLDPNQTLKAAQALVSHIQKEQKRLESASEKKDLLATGDGEDEAHEKVPVWLILGTKKFIQDQKRLKPSKIALPHPFGSPDARVCLITVDPQRAFKNLIAEPTFPASVSSRISRVIGISKLKAKYKSYESRRQLFAEYDVFLADERIVTFLVATLGKIFYGTTAKKPLPVNLTAGVKTQKDENGKKSKVGVKKGETVVGTPEAVGKEIGAALNAALVHISPSVSTAIRVATADMAPKDIAENVEAVVEGLTAKFVSKGWRNVRSVHIKGPNTMALPVWLAEELWVEDADVLEEKWKPKEFVREEGLSKKKRKWEEWEDEMLDDDEKVLIRERKPKKSKKVKKPEADKAVVDDLAKETASRKQKLKEQKTEALKAIEAPPIKAPEVIEKKKKSKKRQAVAA